MSEIDLPAARARAERMHELLTQNHDTRVAESDLVAAQAELQKAVTRIDLAG